MAHSLPPLPYTFNALEPHIDARTMEIHHGKAPPGLRDEPQRRARQAPELHEKWIEDLLKGIASVPDDIRQAVINNGGGHYNHTLFWSIMGPNAGGAPSGELGEAIASSFGSF